MSHIRQHVRIIVVEDDVPLLKSVVRYLSLDGYKVTGVGSAREFYQHIFSEPYALAVLDIGLPDQDGLVLSEYVRKNTGMRIIMFTARSSIEEQIAGQKAGADIYLVKPVDFRQLSASIEALLSRMEEHPASICMPHPLPQDDCWRILSGKWQLGYRDQTIKLTNKELHFMTLLLAEPGSIVPRTRLLEELGYLNTESGNHSLQSLINRLRRKIESQTGSMPIQTVHAIGYTFEGAITVE